jgi:hypothetical protein
MNRPTEELLRSAGLVRKASLKRLRVTTASGRPKPSESEPEGYRSYGDGKKFGHDEQIQGKSLTIA